MTNENRSKIVAECNIRVLALRKHVDPQAAIPIGGTTHTGTGVIEVYQGMIDAQTAVDSLRAQLAAALAARDRAHAARGRADGALRAWVVNTFGENSQQAHDFGFPPPKQRVISAETKARAVEKLRATRAARHTTGKRQKARIKGVVEQQAAANSDTGGGVAKSVA